MKLFDVNWLGVIRDLPRWTALSIPARRVLLNELKTHGYVPAHKFAPYLDAIVSSGIATYDAEKDRAWLGDERRGLVKVLRAMNRHPLFQLPTQHVLVSYLAEHFTNEEIQQLGSQASKGRVMHIDKNTLARRVSFAGWPGDLLEARGDDGLLHWAEGRGVRIDPTRVDVFVVIVRELQSLAQQLLPEPDGTLLRDIIADARNRNTAALADAIYAGLGTAVLFAGLNDDLEPVIGLWPVAANDLVSPIPQKPAPAEVTEPFTLAIDMEDMTTVLSAMAASPVRVRANDYGVFARSRAEIEARLVALPRWAIELHAQDRVDHAARELQLRAFVRMRNIRDTPHLEATPAGMHWLALSAHDRLASLVEPLRNSKDTNPRNAYDGSHVVGFFPFTLPYANAPKSLHAREYLTRLFLDAGTGFIAINDFLEFGTRNDNPFLAVPPNEITLYSGMYYGGGDPREIYRDMWRDMLLQFLVQRLVALGGATIGIGPHADVCFSLTDVGRYLLGASDHFTYGSAHSTDIVVQPNFDVVFLGTAPALEAEIARFAERAGSAPGLAFRLTRASVLAAAERGAAATDVLDTLAGASSKPIPTNVQREIAGWMGVVRRVTIRRVDLLECPDAETANRLVAILGNKVNQVGPTTFTMPVSKPSVIVAIMKKLRAAGVFLDDITVHPESAGTARREPRFENDWDQ